MLRRRFGKKYPLPKIVIPKWLVWLIAPWIDSSLTRKLVLRNVGYSRKDDNSKSKEHLGINYRTIYKAAVEMIMQMDKA